MKPSSAFDPFPHHHHNSATAPGNIFIRYIVYAIIITVVITLGNMFTGEFRFYKLTGFVLAGWSVAAWWWIGETVWRSIVVPMVVHSSYRVQYVARLPLWYMISGIGYTLGLLLAQKLGIFYVYDIPVQPVFLCGGMVGVGIQSVLHGVAYWRKRAAYRPVIQ